MDKYLGKRLDGRYEIHELIGIGGMANVYRCTDTLDDREVAIKILKDEFLNNEEFIRRFKNESKAIAMLSHPNIVKVYDVSFGDMIQYIVMEYIDGITLKEYIDRQGVIEWKDTLHLTTQVLRALQHAHESGIVHRDIKPQNIMLLQDGTIKVTDFGIARFSDKATRTMTDQAIGSVHYIAPEQARGDVTDGKTDIYSVGVMLYEMLTGKLPFEGDSAVTVALMQLQSTPKRPREVNPSIPAGLEQITMRAMEKQPENRYTSAAEMLSDIERFRLNPSIVFDYGTSFVDSQPTKFVDPDKKEVEGEPETDEQAEAPETEKKAKKEKVKKEKKEKPPKPEKQKKEKPDKAARQAEREKLRAEREQARREAAEKRKKRKEPQPNFEEPEIKEHGSGFYAVKGILISAVIMTLIFVVLAVIMALTSNQAKDVTMPGYVGKSLSEAKEENPDNFQFEIKSRFDDTQTLGTVLTQDPAEGMTVKAGSIVTLTVNSNEDEISVPFFNSNMKQKDVVKKIKELGLVPEVILVDSDKTAKDYVISTFPVAGSKTPIGSTVYIYISNGSRGEIVEIPALIGTKLANAQSELEDLGLTVEVIPDDDSREKKDTVLGSSPLPHGKVEQGTVVTLYVSSGVGDRSKVTLKFDLPENFEKEMEMTVTVDGEKDWEKSRTVYPGVDDKIELEFTGTGTKKVEVTLDEKPYREYEINFTKGTVNTVMHDFDPNALPTDPTEPSDDDSGYTPPYNPYDDDTDSYNNPYDDGGFGF